MMIRRIFLAAIVFAFLATALFWDVRRAREAEGKRLASARLIGQDAKTLGELTIHNVGALLKLERGPAGWRMTAPMEADADPDSVATLLDLLNRQQKIGALEATPDELRKYGLEQPPVKVEMKGEKGAAWTLMIGEDSPVGGNVYARMDPGSEFFTVSTALRDQLRRPPAEYRDRRLLPIDVTQAVRISLTSAGSTLRMVKEGPAWKITQPIEDAADDEAINNLLQEMNATRAIDFINTATLRNAGTFGLEAPSIVASFALEGPDKDAGEATLLVGLRRYAEGRPTYYARRANAEKVFTIPQALYEKLQPAPELYRSKIIFSIPAKNVTRLSVRYGRSDTRLVRNTAGAWEYEDEPKSPIDSAFVAQTLASILRIRIVEFLPVQPLPEDSGMDDPSLTLTVSDATGKTEGVESGRTIGARDLVHARRLGTSEVFGIGGDQPGQFFLSRDDFERKTLFSFVPNDVSSIEVHEGSSIWIFQRQQDAWLCQPSSGGDPFQVKTVAVQRFLDALQILQWKRRLDPNTPDGKRQIESHGLLTTDRLIRLVDAKGNELASLAEGDNDPTRVYIRRGQNEYYALEKPIYAFLVEALKPLFAR